MLPAHIKAVVFDAVGTVLHPVDGAPKVYAETAAKYGIIDTPAAILARFREAYLVEEEIDRLNHWLTDEAREVRRWQAIVAAALPGSPAECFEELYRHFAKPEAWFAPPEAQAVFAELKERNLGVGLGSNYDSRLLTVIAGRPELRALRSKVFVSSIVGSRKPGRDFFSAVAADFRCNFEEIAFVGDDLKNDYEGAAQAGMCPILLDAMNQHPEVANRIVDLCGLLRR